MSLKQAVAVAALAAFAAAACNRNPQASGPPQMPPTPVGLAAAHTEAIEDATEYVANVKSLRSTPIQPQIDGQITQIYVKSGDRVAQGAPLLQIDPRRQQAAVSSQQAELAAREAAVAFAHQQAQRTAEANLKALQAQLQQQEVQLRYYTVTAPTAGIVGDVPVRVGNLVTPQTVLTTVDQNEALEVYVNVPVERSSELKRGLPIRIMSGDGSEQLAATTITFISPHVDDQTQSVLVKGPVPNSEGKFRAQQFVRARVIWKTTEGLVVPVTAVLRINGQFFAFVAEQASPQGLVAKQRAIKVGPIVGDNYPVLDGIKNGDRVVVSGAQKLADGVPIQPAPASSS